MKIFLYIITILAMMIKSSRRLCEYIQAMHYHTYFLYVGSIHTHTHMIYIYIYSQALPVSSNIEIMKSP